MAVMPVRNGRYPGGVRIVSYEAGAPRPACDVCDVSVPSCCAAVATARGLFCGACVAAHGRGLRLLSTGSCSELDAFVARIGLAAHLELKAALADLDAATRVSVVAGRRGIASERSVKDERVGAGL
jgi:hypothetical protein